jgi:HEAT repeat protein
MKAFFLIAMITYIYPASLFAQNDITSPELKPDEPFSTSEQLDNLLNKIENGNTIDVNQINTLDGLTRRLYDSAPGGLSRWNEFIKGLTAKYPNATYKIIRKGIQDSDKYILGLGDVGGEQNVNFLIDYLKERLERINKLIEQGEKEDSKEWRVNQAVVMALARTKNKKGLPILHQALKSDFVNMTAMDELSRAGDESLIPEIRNWLISGDKSKELVALKATVLLSNEQLKPKLMEILHEPIAKIFSEVKNQKDDSNSYRYTIQALASIGDESILPTLHKMAQDESEYLKEVEEMKNWPDPWRGRHEPLNYSQNEALNAIEKLASPKSLETLDKIATEAHDENIRKKAKKIAVEIRKLTDTQ